jgi:SAM-dependent methyltransferase
MKPPIAGAPAVLKHFVSNYKFKSILDIGCGRGNMFRFLKGKEITGIDVIDKNKVALTPGAKYIQDNISTYTPDEKYDAVMCCHLIEHVPDTESFIKTFFSFIDEGSPWCIIWPPPKPQVVGGHVHVFNHGMMLYNIVRTGIDCSNVRLVKKEYSNGIMGVKKSFKLPQLIYVGGELELLAKWFPFKAKQNFDGNNVPGLKVLRG